jgi:hypothetical protein
MSVILTAANPLPLVEVTTCFKFLGRLDIVKSTRFGRWFCYIHRGERKNYETDCIGSFGTGRNWLQLHALGPAEWVL